MTAPERPGPERPGPDYPPEWDLEPDDDDPCLTCGLTDCGAHDDGNPDLIAAMRHGVTEPPRPVDAQRDGVSGSPADHDHDSGGRGA